MLHHDFVLVPTVSSSVVPMSTLRSGHEAEQICSHVNVVMSVSAASITWGCVWKVTVILLIGDLPS